MKTLQNTNHSSFSSKINFIIALFAVLVMGFAQPAIAAGSPDDCAMQQATGTTLLLQLGETMSGSQVITVENLIANEPGFGSPWWSVTPTERMQAVLFSNISGNTLPANTAVAHVTISDPVYGFTHEFTIGTDGGAIIMILGDF